MFLGELMCLFVWFFKTGCKGQQANDVDDEDEVPLSPGGQIAKQKKLKTKINPFLLAIPASFDFFGSTLMFVALTQCAASVYQMMRGSIVLITAVFSVIFLGRKQYFHHWSSLFIIVAGVALVGLVGVSSSNNGDDDSKNATPTTFTGVLLLIIAQCFTGGQFITEELFLSGYYLDPFLVVGLEGMWGCIYYAILLPIAQNIKCDGPLCHGGVLEDSKLAFKQMGEYPELIVMSVGIIISISCFNATGVTITKYASSA
jgi:drug/metabolite transporter (DMT)-like permease